MAEIARLDVILGGDVKPLVSAMNKASTEVEVFSDKADASFEKVEEAVVQLSAESRKVFALMAAGANEVVTSVAYVPKSFDEVRASIDEVAADFAAKWDPIVADAAKLAAPLNQAGQAAAGLGQKIGAGLGQAAAPLKAAPVNIDKVKTATQGATLAVGNFGRVLQDVPYGFIGISNNLNPLLESFQRLKTQSKDAGVSIGSVLVKSLKGAGGLGFALSAVTAALGFAQIGLSFWTRGLGGAKKATEDTAKATDEYAEAMDRARKATAQEFDQVAKLIAQSQLAATTRGQQATILKDLQKISQEYFGDLKIENGLIVGLSAAYENYANNILKVAKAKAASETIGKITEELLKVKQSSLDLENIFTNLNLNLSTAGKLIKGAAGANAFEKLTEASKKTAAIMDKALPTFEDIAFLSEVTGKSEAEINRILADRGSLKLKELQLTAKIAALSKLIAQNDLGGVGEAKDPKAKKEKKLKDFNFYTFDPKIAEQGFNARLAGLRDTIEKDISKSAEDIKPGVITKPFEIDKSAWKLLSDDLSSIATRALIDSLSAIGEGLADAITGDGNLFGKLFTVIGEGIKALGKKLIEFGVLASAVKKALDAVLLTPAGPALVIAAGIALTTLGSVIANQGVKMHAEGGIFTQPTLIGGHLFGEKGPEALVPLNKLQDMGAGMGGMNVSVNGTLRGRGSELIAVINTANLQAGRNYGRNFNTAH